MTQFLIIYCLFCCGWRNCEKLGVLYFKLCFNYILISCRYVSSRLCIMKALCEYINLYIYSTSQEICTLFILCCDLWWLSISQFLAILPTASKESWKTWTTESHKSTEIWQYRHKKLKHNKTLCIFYGLLPKGILFLPYRSKVDTWFWILWQFRIIFLCLYAIADVACKAKGITSEAAVWCG